MYDCGFAKENHRFRFRTGGIIIKDNKIVGKHLLELPETVTNIIKCKNPRCITSIEQELPHKFKLTNR